MVAVAVPGAEPDVEHEQHRSEPLGLADVDGLVGEQDRLGLTPPGQHDLSDRVGIGPDGS